MNITRDVVTDLWPLYVSGDASEDTRRLIEEFLNNDQEFAKLIRESSEDSLRMDVLPPLRRERELETLRTTKRLLRVRDSFFWIAIFLTFTPLTVYDTSWGSGWVIRDYPLLASGLAAAAAIVWCFYFMLKRRLSSSGL